MFTTLVHNSDSDDDSENNPLSDNYRQTYVPYNEQHYEDKVYGQIGQQHLHQENYIRDPEVDDDVIIENPNIQKFTNSANCTNNNYLNISRGPSANGSASNRSGSGDYSHNSHQNSHYNYSDRSHDDSHNTNEHEFDISSYSKPKIKVYNGYLFGDILGVGSFAKVKEVLSVESLSRYAIKIFRLKELRKKHNNRSEVADGQIQNEISIGQTLKHENVIKLVDNFHRIAKDKKYLVFEYCLCNLQQMLKRARINAIEKEIEKERNLRAGLGLVQNVHSAGIRGPGVPGKGGNQLLSDIKSGQKSFRDELLNNSFDVDEPVGVQDCIYSNNSDSGSFENELDTTMSCDAAYSNEKYKHIKGRLPEPQANHYFKQLLKGLEYLQNTRVAHKDIKPANLLIAKGHVLKIADFGLAEKIGIFNEDNTFKTVDGTPYFMSPDSLLSNQQLKMGYQAIRLSKQKLKEQMLARGQDPEIEIIMPSVSTYFAKTMNGYKHDIWSAGVVLYNMMSGEYPFRTKAANKFKLFDEIEENNYHDPSFTFSDATLGVVGNIKDIRDLHVTELSWFL